MISAQPEFSPKKILFLLAVFFALIFPIGRILAQPIQIEPSPTPRPACFTDWGSLQDEDSGGVSSGECYNAFSNLQGNNNSHSLKQYYRVTRDSPHCTFGVRYRDPILCPSIAETVNLSVDKDHLDEKGQFTITWSSKGETNPDAQCTLSGKAPEKGNFSEETRDGQRTYTYVQRGIYAFQFACNGILNNIQSLETGAISKNLTVYVGNIPPPPAVNLNLDPGVIKKGEKATLSWSSENTITLSMNQGVGAVRPKGSITVSPDITTRYTITGAGEFSELGLARKSATLRVIAPEAPKEELPPAEIPPEAPPPPPPPTEKLKVDLKINGKDGPLTFGSPAYLNLSWNLNQYCLAYGSWIGVKNKSGSEQRIVTKPGIYTYKLYCPTIGSDEVAVTVSGSGPAAIPLPIAEASASTDGKNFSQSIRVIRGEAAQLWISAAYDTNKDKKVSRDETGKWTSLMSNGGRCEYNLDLNQGTPTFEGAVNDPKNPEACTVSIGKLTFYDKPGVYRYGVLRLVQNNGKVSNVGYINIAVDESPLPKGPPIIDLRINNLPGPAVALGAPAEYDVSWNAQNADSCSASESWNGDKFPAGSQHFAASGKKEFVYALTCIGKLGTAKRTINLKVAELPVCDFSALPLTIDKNSPFNRQSALTWKCQFANTCSISPAVGNVETFGSARVSPKETTKYSLTCQNLEGSSSFDQAVEVQ